MTTETAAAILKRLAIAIAGYAVFFPAYLALFGLATRAPAAAGALAKTALNTLVLPLTDAQQNVHLLSRFRGFAAKPGRQPFVDAVVRDLRLALATEALLFIALIAAVYFFERFARKSPRSVALFYASVPVLLWILWSQCFLLI